MRENNTHQHCRNNARERTLVSAPGRKGTYVHCTDLVSSTRAPRRGLAAWPATLHQRINPGALRYGYSY